MLRMRPDRIIVGEARGAEALDLLKAWNTGHSGGFTTIHANSAAAALIRLESLIEEAGVAPSPRLIAEAVDLLIFIARRPDGARRIAEIVRVEGCAPDGGYRLKQIVGVED
jgi:type IV secretion system protein VirB11